MTPQGLVEVAEFDTQDGIYDCAWSEVGKSATGALHDVVCCVASSPTSAHGCSCQENENILVSSCGDGSIKVWDVAAPPASNPLRSYQEHSREVGTVQRCTVPHSARIGS